MEPVPEPAAPSADREVEDFWNLARFHARLAALPGYLGASPLASLPPPTWSFGDDEGGQQLLADLLADGTAVTSSPRSEYDDPAVGLPTVGTLGIVLDERGRPRALVVTDAVEESDDAVVEHLRVLYRGD